jgi:Family of unknown function (DUF5989)
LSFRLHVEVKELRDGFPERVVLFMRVRKKFWLMPFFFILVTVGGLMVLLTKGSATTKEWNLLKEEFDALVRNGFPLQGSLPYGRGGRAFTTADTDE